MDAGQLLARIERLEMVVAMLLDALARKDSERDGNWGWQTFGDEIKGLLITLQQPSN